MIDLSTLTMTEIVRLQNQLQQELTRRFERRLMLVFSDIVGSTPYFAHFGDAAGRQLQQLHFDLLGRSLEGTSGRIVDTAGDGAFLVFETADEAVRCIIAFQNGMAHENDVRGALHQLQVRVGLHWGSVLTDGAVVSGDAVNLCSRVAGTGAPGEVRLTREALLVLGREHRSHCQPLGATALKGVPVKLELFALDWRDPTLFPRQVRIDETGEQIELPQRDIVTFGRLPDKVGVRCNDIVLLHPDAERARQVSRWHFELRRGGDGLWLHALSDSPTEVDGKLVARGEQAAVRAGSVVRVAELLTLRLLAGASFEPEADLDSTRMVLPTAANRTAGGG
jgi:class 3 adenylate cyclase